MLRYISTVLCGLVMSASALLAQNQRLVDSLHHVLRGQSGGERFPALYDMAFEYLYKDNVKALQYIEEAGTAAHVSGDSLWIVKSIRVRGQILYLLGRSQQAISVLEPIATRRSLIQFPKEYFLAMNTIATSRLFMFELDKSLDLHFKINRDAREAGVEEVIPRSLSNIGLVYYKLKDYRKALHYMKEGLNVVKDSTDLTTLLMNISLCYSHLGNVELAQKHLDASIQACSGHCPAERLMHVKYASGYIQYRSGRFSQAQSEFLKSFDLATKKQNTRIQLDNLYLLAKMAVSEGQLGKARRYLDHAERILKMGTPFNLEKVKIFEQLSQLYLTIEDFKKAAFYQSAYIRLKDSIYNENVTARLMHVESHYLESENQAKIAEQQQIIHLNNEVMKRQHKLNVLYATVAVLTAMIVLFLFKIYCKKKLLNAFLRKKIQERTRELEANRLELEKKASHQQLMLNRAFSGVSGRLATVKGLCLTARGEIADPVARAYMDKIDHASSKVDQFLRSVLKDEESIKTHKNHG